MIEAILHDQRPQAPIMSYLREYYPEASPFHSIACSLLICENVNRWLGHLQDESIQSVVTSPPYSSLRDYSIEDPCGESQQECVQVIGAEYLAGIVRIV